MKKYLLLATCVLFMFSCSKEKSPEPEADLGTRVAGTYQISKAEFNGQVLTLPFNGISMSIKLTRLTEKTADLLVTSTIDGSSTSAGGTVDLAKNGSKITLSDVTGEIGYVDGKLIHLASLDEDGIPYTADGSK